MIGTTLGHYRIVEKIGEGGMGEVYRAHDERLDRDVAIKVMHQKVAQDAERLARFEREATAVAKLAHPNVLEIWDFGTEDGITYAVTELLEGQNLRARIPTSGLPWQKVVEIGAAIADGLAAAHGKGIVHRDLKPENVFVTSDGRVKVLDFGLARVLEEVLPEAETATLTPAGTETGTIMGTVGYMAPEQVKGRPADHRSDVFALGCVLYEMVSGRRPFEGDTTVETMAAILKEEPTQLSSTGATLPGDLERTVHRCLEKSPTARFQSAADLAFGLRSIGTGPAVMMATPTGEVRPVTRKKRWSLAAAVTAVAAIVAVVGWGLLSRQPAPGIPDVKHIAVLPFEAVGDDPEGRFLAAGLAQTVTDGLTIMERETRGATWVVPPAPGLTLEQARTEHNATIAIRGVFTPGVERVRLDVDLVDIASGRTLLHRTLDESVRNITSLQKEPVRMVWEMLGFEATPAAIEYLEDSSTNTLTACRAFVSGRGRLSTATDEAGLQGAVASLESAIAEDPAFLPVRVALAGAFARLFEETHAEQWKERAIAEAEYAIRLDADSPEPYLALGKVHGDDGETELEL
ncbi:MAG: protein kinase, partial [Acidobacteria bacterium]|nr:protein kinase [Candidatus Sulfomarinibacter kjeldsenii]